MCCLDNPPDRGHEIIVLPGSDCPAESLPWNPHPKFTGVSLPHLVASRTIGAGWSLHHVRIDPGCTIGNNTHPGQVEIHNAPAGESVCTVEGKDVRRIPGVMGICLPIPYTGLLQENVGSCCLRPSVRSLAEGSP